MQHCLNHSAGESKESQILCVLLHLVSYLDCSPPDKIPDTPRVKYPEVKLPRSTLCTVSGSETSRIYPCAVSGSKTSWIHPLCSILLSCFPLSVFHSDWTPLHAICAVLIRGYQFPIRLCNVFTLKVHHTNLPVSYPVNRRMPLKHVSEISYCFC